MRSLTDRPPSLLLSRGLLVSIAVLLALLLALLTPFSLPHIIPKSLLDLPSLSRNETTVLQPFTIITLAFGAAAEGTASAALLNNCEHATRAGFVYEIHTENITREFCNQCKCVQFRLRHCPCPNPAMLACNHCEKLFFLIDQLVRLGEFLFLDSDLVIVKSSFLTRLYPRTRVHDALASVGHINPKATKYYSNFNSGLLFLRRLPGLDYSEMGTVMYQEQKNQDQGIVTRFVHKYYTNWDYLSLKWHCRFLTRVGYDIPPTECYTVHDQKEGSKILKTINYTMLRPTSKRPIAL